MQEPIGAVSEEEAFLAVREGTRADDIFTTTEGADGEVELVTDEAGSAPDEEGNKPVEENVPASYDEFKDKAEATWNVGQELKNEINQLNEQRQYLNGLDALDQDQEKRLGELNQEYVALSEQADEHIALLDELITTQFNTEDEDNLYVSLMNIKTSLMQSINPDYVAKVDNTELSQDSLDQVKDSLSENKTRLGLLLDKLNSFMNDNPQVGDFSKEFTLVAISDQIFKEFDGVYEESLEKIKEINPGLIDLINNPSMDETYKLILELKKEINGLNLKKEMVYIKTSELAGFLTSQTNSEANENIDNLVANESITTKEAKNIKDRLKQVQEYAGIGLDGFIELNKGSSLDTFLAFLIDPINTNGNNGQELKFGRTSLGEVGDAEIVPLHLFRALFTDHKRVGSVLRDVMQMVDSSWRSDNGQLLAELENNDDPKKIKEVLLKIFGDLLTNNEKEDEHQQKFRAYFATALMGKNTDQLQYMDENSFVFLVENLKDDGTKLDSLWGLDG